MRWTGIVATMLTSENSRRSASSPSAIGGRSARSRPAKATTAPSRQLAGAATNKAVTKESGRSRAARPRRQQVELSTRERIVIAAAEAFAARGYYGVNLAEVVEELGFTKGAFYFYFDGKDALVSEIVNRHFAAWEQTLPAMLNSADDRVDAIVEASHRVAESYRSNPIARAGTRLSAERNLVGVELPEPFVDWIDKISRLLQEAKRLKQVRPDLAVRPCAQMIVGAFYGIQGVSDYLSDRRDLHAQLDQFWGLVLPSLRG